MLPVIYPARCNSASVSALEKLIACIVRARAIILLFSALVTVLPAQASETADKRIRFDIPSLPLASALALFSVQSGEQVSASADLVQGIRSTGLVGEYLPEEALRQLLNGADLDFDRNADGAFALRRADVVMSAITVSARAVSESVYDVPAGTSAVSRSDIERTAPRHASEILQGVPGTSTVTNEQVPGVAISIRGLKDFGRVNMNIDGMRQNYQRSGYQQRNGEMFFDPELLGGVEISKGPQAVLGSAGVTGGIATLRTLESADILSDGASSGLRLRGTAGLGQYANGVLPSGSVAVASRGDQGELLAAYSRKRSDAYRPGRHGKAFNDGFDFPVNIVNLTDQDQDSLLFKSRWRFLSEHSLQFTATGIRADYAESMLQDRDAAYARYVACNPMPAMNDPLYVYCRDYGLTAYDPDSAYPVSRFNEVRSASYSLDHVWQPLDNPDTELATKLYYVTTENRSRAVSDIESQRLTRTDTVGVSVNRSGRHELFGSLPASWLLGTEAFLDRALPSVESGTLTPGQQSAINGSTPRGNRLLANVFTQFSLEARPWLTVTPGLRYELYRLWGTTGFEAYDESNNNQRLWEYSRIDVDHFDWRLLPSLGAVLGPWADVRFFANAAMGWRPPAITEVLITEGDAGAMQSVQYFPNYRLKPEETVSFELGMSLKKFGLMRPADVLGLKVTGFHHETDHYIQMDSMIGVPGSQYVSVLNGMFVNGVTPMSMKGLEVDMTYDAGSHFLRLGLTRMERDFTFRHLAFPLGGAVGSNSANLNQSMVDGSGFYMPAPPRYNGRLSPGFRFMDQSGESGVVLACASEAGHAYTQAVTEEQRSFCVVDAFLEYQVSNVAGFSISMKNIFDRQYAQAMGDSYVRTYAPGRSMMLAVEIRL